MARTLRVYVVLGGRHTSQGTAWFVDEYHVVTALHVVGSVADDEWAHKIDARRTYALGDGRKLTSVAKSASDDVALLRTTEPQAASEVISLGAEAARASTWYTVGFPGFSASEFALTGSVANIAAAHGAKSLQLLVDQGTNVDWGGISGSPVIAAGGSVGVLTNVTGEAATAWAAPVAAVRALLESAGVQLRADVAAKELSRELAELRLAARAALDADTTETHRIRSSLSHALEMCAIHEARIEFFTKQLQTPLAMFTPYFQEELEKHRRGLEDAIDNLRALLVRRPA